ncbi:uncharacterized protein LOC134288300 [Aedes albopictus]|uniref:Uncharacterized protein n=1 Tax=Aedes albopictus TaxID=7160 RepID=A0ABM2A496_AEDAL
MDLDRSKGLLLLLEAAEVLSEARDIGVICETPTVAQYEEVVTGLPAPGFQNRDSSFQSNLSFENIVASTPIKEFRDPHILPALDLSLSFVEEPPLDLSLRSNDVDIPLDLAPVCRQERIACAEADECLPLNLAAVKGTVSGSPALHQFNHDTQHAEARSPDMNTDKPETSCRLESSVEDNSSPKSSSGKNNHRPLVSNPPTPAVRDSLETINQVNNSVILSPKNDANPSDPSLNPHETNTIPVQLSVSKPTERAQYKEVPQAADDWDPGSEDEDDDDRQIGDATFLNNFSVHEYFEVYRNNDLLGDDEDDVIDECTDDPDKCKLVDSPANTLIKIVICNLK